MEGWPHPGTPIKLIVKTWSGKNEYVGLALQSSEKNIITIKLVNGYNISFPESYVENFEIMDNQPTVMTEKDAIKCSFLDHTNYWYLKIEAEVSDNFEQDFLAEIKSK